MILRFWQQSNQARRTLIFASSTHVWSDLFFALYAPLLPLIKNDLDLTFTEVALLKSVYAGASAVLQVPAGFIAERIGEFWLLIGGNIWVGAGLISMALAPGFALLLGFTLVGGLGGGTQHPLASAMVSRAYEDKGRATAVGTVNFAGDIGKLLAPVLALVIAVNYGWRITMLVIGVAAIVYMVLTLFIRRSINLGRPDPTDNGPHAPGGTIGAGYITLSIVGFLDSATRAAALTFVPFILEDKGYSISQIFSMLILLLIGGAAGKYLCGRLSERYGTIELIWITKGIAAGLLVLTVYTPASLIGPLMIVLGITLNGTSSVLYSTVAEMVPNARRSRIYGFFYTTNESGSFAAPLFYGLIADIFSVRTSMVIMGILTAVILPVSLPLRTYLDRNKAWKST